MPDGSGWLGAGRSPRLPACLGLPPSKMARALGRQRGRGAVAAHCSGGALQGAPCTAKPALVLEAVRMTEACVALAMHLQVGGVRSERGCASGCARPVVGVPERGCVCCVRV